MRVMEAYSIHELLKREGIKGNKSRLAKALNINRATVNRYLDDYNCERHVVTKVNDKYVFMASTRRETEYPL